MENELFEKEDELIQLQYIDKILYGFSFSDTGSGTVYSKIAKSIRLGQNEIALLKLAKYAKYFCRASDNLRGGGGVYLIAEQ